MSLDVLSGLTDFGSGDIVSSAFDVGSIVDDVGSEFLSSDFSFTDFDIPISDVANLGGYDLVGDFAGNSSWFDTFNAGDILDSVPSVGDFNLSSITDSLPSLDSIKTSLSTFSSDLGSAVKTVQTGIQAYQKVAPVVNLATSALGIQNPINQIIQPLQQATGIAGAASGIATNLTSGGVRSLNTNSLVSSGAAALGINPTVVASVGTLANSAGSTTDPFEASRIAAEAQYNNTTGPTEAAVVAASDTGFFNSLKTAGSNLLDSASSVFSGPGTGFNILTDKELAVVTAGLNPAYVNSFNAGLPGTTNYSQALQAITSTTSALNQYDADKQTATNDILKISDNIYNINERLNDPATTEAERTLLQEQLTGEYDTLAVAQKSLEQTNTAIDAVTAARDQAFGVIATTATAATNAATPVDAANNTYYTPSVTTTLPNGETVTTTATPSVTLNTVVGNPNVVQGVDIAALTMQAKNQQTLRDLRQNKAQSSDWRVRLRLAPNSQYLYNDPNGAGILDPLKVTDGVIFPYTPAIETAYKANYETYDLTHSNYRGYFYKSSYVDAINMRCTFTAQDTKEANYLLAVIHFFRSVTKMFYGQDPERGSPPPLVFLSGLGDYQFNEHPSVVSQFNYTLPADVDYIRAYSTLDMSTNLLNNRTRTSIGANPVSYAANRLLNSGLFTGAQPSTKTIGNLPIKEPTYVPTKMEISISLLPIQSRQQVSKQFSLKGFANGNLLKGGFW